MQVASPRQIAKKVLNAKKGKQKIETSKVDWPSESNVTETD